MDGPRGPGLASLFHRRALLCLDTVSNLYSLGLNARTASAGSCDLCSSYPSKSNLSYFIVCLSSSQTIHTTLLLLLGSIPVFHPLSIAEHTRFVTGQGGPGHTVHPSIHSQRGLELSFPKAWPLGVGLSGPDRQACGAAVFGKVHPNACLFRGHPSDSESPGWEGVDSLAEATVQFCHCSLPSCVTALLPAADSGDVSASVPPTAPAGRASFPVHPWDSTLLCQSKPSPAVGSPVRCLPT